MMSLAACLIFLSGALADCARAQTVDLSTDEAVLAELQKVIDAKKAELIEGDERLEAKRKAANKLEAKDVCIERLKASVRVIVIGFFRTDVGCHFDGAFVGSRYFERDDADLSRTALNALGWEKANRTKRESLAKIWVEEGLLRFSEMPYQTLSAATINDEIKVTASSKYPPGVTSRSAPKKFVFDKNGSLISADNY